MNKLIIIGRLTADPELRTTGTGKNVCNFTVAVDGRSKEDDTTFFRCTAGKQADYVAKYQQKGNKVAVVGRIGSRKYTDKEGQQKETWEVQAESIEGLTYTADSGSGGANNGSRKAGGNQAKNTRTAPAPEAEYDPFGDD